MLYEEVENIHQAAMLVIEEAEKENKVLYDMNGEFVAWLIGHYIFNSDMQPIMYYSEGNIWSWQNRNWIGQLIGNGVYTDKSEIVFTLAPREELEKRKAIKSLEKSTRPPKSLSIPRRDIPEKQPQVTRKTLFTDWNKRQ